MVKTIEYLNLSALAYVDFKNKRNPGAFCLWLFKENNFLNIYNGTYDDNLMETRRLKTDEEIAEEYDFDEYDKR